MKSSLRLLLPVGLVLAIVFGITFITNYTDNSPPTIPGGDKKADPKTTAPPLLFGITNAEPNGRIYFLQNFKLDWEVGAEGFYDFWFQNANSERVLINLAGKNCTCAGAKLGLISAGAQKAYLENAAAAAMAPGLLQPLLLPAAAVDLVRGITWQEMTLESEVDRKEVPAASAVGPQLGIFRMTFSGKTPGDTRLTKADVVIKLGDGPNTVKTLSVQNRTVPSINAFYRGVASGNGLFFGEMQPDTKGTRDVYFFSATRPDMQINLRWLAGAKPEPLIELGKPVLLTDADLEEMLRQLAHEPNAPNMRMRSVYRMPVTVYERRMETDGKGEKSLKQMEIGPFEFVLTAELGDGLNFNSVNVPVRGIVRGEVSVVGGPNEKDQIDFGKAVDSRTGAVKEVEVIANKPGTDIELIADATMPQFLEAKLTYKGEENGLKRWNLKVRIPPDKFYGGFAKNSTVILQIKDEAKRRIRIPVLGQAIDSRPF